VFSYFLGGQILEKHFTLLDKEATKDGHVSVTAKELQFISRWCNKTHEEILEMYPEWGRFVAKKDDKQRKLIGEYKERWNTSSNKPSPVSISRIDGAVTTPSKASIAPALFNGS